MVRKLTSIKNEVIENKYIFLWAVGLILVSWIISWGIALYQYRLTNLSTSIDYILEYHNPNDVPLMFTGFIVFFALIGLIFNPKST